MIRGMVTLRRVRMRRSMQISFLARTACIKGGIAGCTRCLGGSGAGDADERVTEEVGREETGASGSFATDGTDTRAGSLRAGWAGSNRKKVVSFSTANLNNDF